MKDHIAINMGNDTELMKIHLRFIFLEAVIKWHNCIENIFFYFNKSESPLKYWQNPRKNGIWFHYIECLMKDGIYIVMQLRCKSRLYNSFNIFSNISNNLQRCLKQRLFKRHATHICKRRILIK